jgi:hypothetical protein
MALEEFWRCGGTKLVHCGPRAEANAVNNLPGEFVRGLILLPEEHWRRLSQARDSVNNLCISIHCRFSKLRYDVRSSLKERSRQKQLKDCGLFVSRIIPGDWGKVGSGWLARSL